MSTTLGSVKSTASPDPVSREIYVNQFWGGKERGRCLQLTIGERYVQLDREGVTALRELLDGYEADEQMVDRT